jgi:hypothetical protein
VFRETADSAGQSEEELIESIDRHEAKRANQRSAWLLSALEAYKASCRAAGEVPTQEDAWLVVLSALQLEDAV